MPVSVGPGKPTRDASGKTAVSTPANQRGFVRPNALVPLGGYWSLVVEPGCLAFDAAEFARATNGLADASAGSTSRATVTVRIVSFLAADDHRTRAQTMGARGTSLGVA